jgi:hypothetical protein
MMDLDSIETKLIADVEGREFERWIEDRLGEYAGVDGSSFIKKAFINLLAEYARANHEAGTGSTFYGYMVNLIDMLQADDDFINRLRAELEEKGRED